MSTRRRFDRVRELIAEERRDFHESRRADGAWLSFCRYLLEIPAVFGLGLRQLCTLAVAIAFETYRHGEEKIWTVEDSPSANWSWTGPGFEHSNQSAAELRLAALGCVATAWLAYEILGQFHRGPAAQLLFYATLCPLVVEPAWVEYYTQQHSETLRAETRPAVVMQAAVAVVIVLGVVWQLNSLAAATAASGPIERLPPSMVNESMPATTTLPTQHPVSLPNIADRPEIAITPRISDNHSIIGALLRRNAPVA